MFAYVVCINSTCSCLYISRCSHIEAACTGFLPFVHGFLFFYMSLALTQTDLHACIARVSLSPPIYIQLYYVLHPVYSYIHTYIYICL